MTVGVLAHHALLVLGVAGLGGAGVRGASRVCEAGLERVLVAFTLGCAAAVCESLGLGLFGLGGSSAALGAGALATWAVTRLLVAAPSIGVRRELAGWIGNAAWGSSPGRSVASAPERSGGSSGWSRIGSPVATVGSLAGLVVAWIVWQLRHPLIGGDGLIYHLPIASAWVQNGRPGSVVNVLDGLSVANYPVTNEVLVSWGLAVSRGWVVSSIWSVVLLVVLAGGSWVTMRTLGVAQRERVLGVVGLCVSPLVVAQLCGPDTDIAALAWLAVTAALACGARERPGLIYPAVVAAGLCLGTKTTPAILILGLAVFARRPLVAGLRDHRAWLLGSLALSILVGGVWSIRDLLVHGSPFWPLEASPWGTPVQASLVPLEPSFLSAPRALIENHGSDYLRTMAGGLVLIGGGLLAAAVRRSRAALTVGGLGLVALLAWGVSPYTGIESGDFAAGATRYLLPAIAACTLALVVSAIGAGRAVRLGIDGVLGASIAWSVIQSARLGSQFVPPAPTLGLGLLAGACLTWTARRWVSGGRSTSGAGGVPPARPRVSGGRSTSGAGGVSPARRWVSQGLPSGDRGGDPRVRGAAAWRRAGGPILALGLAAACAVGLAVASDGYVERHARTGEIDGPVLEATLPGLHGGSIAVASGPATVVMLRGDHFEHRLSVIGAGETCGALEAGLQAGPIVLQGEPVTPFFTRLTACLGGRDERFVNEYVDVYYK
jgi:hypothetical protein